MWCVGEGQRGSVVFLMGVTLSQSYFELAVPLPHRNEHSTAAGRTLLPPSPLTSHHRLGFHVPPRIRVGTTCMTSVYAKDLDVHVMMQPGSNVAVILTQGL